MAWTLQKTKNSSSWTHFSREYVKYYVRFFLLFVGSIHSFIHSFHLWTFHICFSVFDGLLDVFCVAGIIVSVIFFPLPSLSFFLSLVEFCWNCCTAFCSRISILSLSLARSTAAYYTLWCVCLHDGLPLPWTNVSSLWVYVDLRVCVRESRYVCLPVNSVMSVTCQL